MNKMKKVLVTLLAALTATSSAASLAACNAPDSGSGEVVAYDGSKVTITFQHTMGKDLKGILDNSLKEFNKIYPNITVNAISPTNKYPDLCNQIFRGITTKNEPSIAFCYPDHVSLYNTMNAVVPLNDYINSTDKVANTEEIMGFTAEQKSDFIEAFYNEGSCYGDDTMYTLPFAKSTEVLYFNKTYFRENNLPLLDELDKALTWTEMKELCQDIVEIETAKLSSGEKLNVIPLGYDSEANWFITMAMQNGEPYTSATGSKFLFNTEKNRAFVEEFRTWYQQGYLTTQELNGSYTSNLFNQTAPDQLKCYMCIGSTGGSTYQAPATLTDGSDPFEVGVAPIPQVNPDDPKVIQQGPSICIFKKNKNPQEVAASWLFAKYFTTNVSFQAQVSMENGYTPVIKSVQENDYYKNNFLAKASSTKNTALQAKTVKLALSLADAYYISDAFDGSTAARTQIELLVQQCFSDGLGTYASATDLVKAKFDACVSFLNNKYPSK